MRPRPAAAIVGKTVKKRAVSVAADTSAWCDNGRYDQSTDAQICHRHRGRPRLKAWQRYASRQSAELQFVAAPILLERIIGGALGRASWRPWRKESPMCDFSLQSVRSRPAQVGDKLVTQDFGTGTRGFASADDRGLAVCVRPGTELAFAGDVACLPTGLLGWKTKTINHQTAIFRQVNKDKMAAHHDALEFPDGRIVLLTLLCEGQAASVLQLPAKPTTAEEAHEQERVSYVG
jgi:hypothetical protein